MGLAAYRCSLLGIFNGLVVDCPKAKGPDRVGSTVIDNNWSLANYNTKQIIASSRP